MNKLDQLPMSLAMDQVKTPRILIVDDEPDLREILTEQLSAVQSDSGKRAFDIDIAVNGADALQKATSVWYDAILSDINMPVMTGLEFLAELRASHKDIPVVFLTAFGDKSKAVEALRLGAFDFLDKPWKAETLRGVISGAVELGYRMRDLEVELEAVLKQYTDITEDRRRQLRAVHRSLLLMKFSGTKSPKAA